MSPSLVDLLLAQEERIAEEVVTTLRKGGDRYAETAPEEIRENAHLFLNVFLDLIGNPDSPQAWDYVDRLCAMRAPRGFQMSEVLHAMLIFKDVTRPLLFEACRERSREELEAYLTTVDEGVMRLVRMFADVYVRRQMEIITRQREAMLELSTPVIQVWKGILTLPLIGTIDSYRARQVTEQLLDRIMSARALHVIIDITGVPVVDTNVANHLIKTIRAANLLGAQCALVGIGPEIAQTLVRLGVDLSGIETRGTLQDGLEWALRAQGWQITPRQE
jgi:rsbT co-antagonist protein RsbR